MKTNSEYYAPPGKWLLDPWFITKDGEHHVFHLQVEPSVDSLERHLKPISIGHAVSSDLRVWKGLPLALEPGVAGQWDDHALWAGSVAEKDGGYYLYYTGKSTAKGEENVQRIGVATSSDLLSWERYPDNPILSADEHHYHMDMGRNAVGTVGSWRDPFVFKDPHSDKRFMTISAKTNDGRTEHNGCVGLAESQDMLHWDILPPIFSPGVYDEIEVTRVIYHNNLYYLFFTTHAASYHPEFATKVGAHEGLHCYVSDNLFGGYTPVNGNGSVFGRGEQIYDMRVLPVEGNTFVGVGWLHKDAQGNFVGKLAPPVYMHIEGDRIYEVPAPHTPAQ